MKETIIIGMSGGVDSAVSAALLVEKGYNVEAVFMKNWDEEDTEFCTAAEDYKDALQVCEELDIPLRSIDLTEEYWENVFKVFLKECESGRTPNPDVLCNKEIKFNQFYKYALSQGFDLIATGHYAKKVNNINSELHSPTDKVKDQTYFLYTLDEKVLRNTVFPLEEMTKDEVKKIATDLGFGLEKKKESMGICFIGKRKFSSFIDSYVEPVKGPIINYNDNQIIGTHEGLSKYTVGQRKGINIGGLKDSIDSPWYVIDKNINVNSLIVSQDQSPLFYTGEIELGQFNAINKISDNQNVKVRFRHGGDLRDCVFNIRDNKYIITLKENERGIAQGQAAVLYIGTRCIGGGTVISKCLNQN